jgi:hypothetical protein
VRFEPHSGHAPGATAISRSEARDEIGEVQADRRARAQDLITLLDALAPRRAVWDLRVFRDGPDLPRSRHTARSSGSTSA